MSGNERRPTLRQRFRAGLKMARDSRTTASARKNAIHTSSGQHIQGTIYYPESDGRAPAVLLLHPASGLTPHEHAMAARLAREGYTALVIAYSSRTTGAVIENDKQRKQLEQITMDGLRALQADPRADANHIAVIGLSLGGYFATHVVLRPKISCLRRQ